LQAAIDHERGLARVSYVVGIMEHLLSRSGRERLHFVGAHKEFKVGKKSQHMETLETSNRQATGLFYRGRRRRRRSMEQIEEVEPDIYNVRSRGRDARKCPPFPNPSIDLR